MGEVLLGELVPHWVLLLVGGRKDSRITKVVNSGDVEEVPSLFSNQKEADTRILGHVNQADDE